MKLVGGLDSKGFVYERDCYDSNPNGTLKSSMDPIEKLKKLQTLKETLTPNSKYRPHQES